MKLNLDYRRALRAGYYIEKNTLRKEYQSAWITTACWGLALGVILLAVILKGIR